MPDGPLHSKEIMLMLIHRSFMPERGLPDILAGYAAREDSFLLSEIIRDSGRKEDIFRTAEALWPLFTTLDLVTAWEAGDLRLERRKHQETRILTTTEQKMLDSFFKSPSLPPWISGRMRDYIEKKTGKRWDDPLVLQKIKRAIVTQKEQYWKEGQEKRISYEKGYSVLGYLAYQAPVYIIQAEHLMYDLAVRKLLKTSMRILDLGTGPGVFPLAIADFFGRMGGCTADIFSIEKSGEFIETFKYLTGPGFPQGTQITIHPPLQSDLAKIHPHDLPTSLDLIIFQNVLNEMTGRTLTEKGSLVREYANTLSPEGTLLLVEPADMANSMDLRSLAHHAAVRGLFLHAPCRFLWGSPCNPERCWSFVEKEPIRPTELMDALSMGDDAYRFRNTDIKYSYALLRKIPPHPDPGTPLSPRHYARLSSLGRHINRRINVAAVLMSGNIGDRRTSVFRICDGTTKRPVYAILPEYHRSPGNEILLSLPYGTSVRFASVLARFNPKYDSYNLLVNRESRVEPLSEHCAGTHAHGTQPRRKKR